MNIATICSENGTWPTHLKRWIRYVKKSNPAADLYLAWAGGMPGEMLAGNDFKGMKMFPAGLALSREWLNTVRMGLTTMFGIEDVIYVDVDCDVYESLEGFKANASHIGWCRSPGVPRPSWLGWHLDKYGVLPAIEANNGMLYLDSDYTEEYSKCWKDIGDSYPDRVRGTAAFNLMLKTVKGVELDYAWAVIWHDLEALPTAKTCHWCNDRGQKKRMELEHLWEACK